jgi:hypothetical protein
MFQVAVQGSSGHCGNLEGAQASSGMVGCKGRAPFMNLPNSDWETFWIPGVAHALLLGVVKDLVYNVLFRQKRDSIPYSREYWVSARVGSQMMLLVKGLSPTCGFPRGVDRSYRVRIHTRTCKK